MEPDSPPPVPSAGVRRQLYQRYKTTGRGSPGVHDSPTDPRLARFLKSVIKPLVPESTDAYIADLGCGGGDLLAALNSAGYKHLSGVDLSSEQVARCHARGLTFVTEGDVQTFLEGRPAGFDCLLAMDLFEHFELGEALSVASAAARALRPGGQLVIRTCNASSPVFGSIRYGDLTHVSAFTDSSIRQLLLAAGFRSVTVRSVPPSGRAVFGLMRRIAWALMSGVVRFYLSVETGRRGLIVSRNLIAVGFV